MLLSFSVLNNEIVACRRCPRLAEHCRRIAEVKRRAFRDWDYWGRPVPSFGDERAQLLIVGLAPGAHGANRTGRMFTGDRSGDFLLRALHETGFASQPESRSRGDGLTLKNAYITAAIHCAPPANKPSPDEIRNCREFLERELALLKRVRVVVALGRLAFDAYLAAAQVPIPRAKLPFAHNRVHKLPKGMPLLISSYHPSQQNTSTGRLTFSMLCAVFEHASREIEPGRTRPRLRDP